MWEIEYYENARGDCEALDFIRSFSDKRLGLTILKSLEDLRNFGPYSLMKIGIVEKVERNLYELRCHFGKTAFRILFCQQNKKIFIALIFIKKTNKLKNRHIELAQRRINKYLNI